MWLLAYVLDWPRSTSAKPTSSLLCSPKWLSVVLKREQKVFNCSSLSSTVRFLLRSWIPLFTIVPSLPSYYSGCIKCFRFFRCCQSCTSRRWSEWLPMNDRRNPGGNEGECSWWNFQKALPLPLWLEMPWNPAWSLFLLMEELRPHRVRDLQWYRETGR